MAISRPTYHTKVHRAQQLVMAFVLVLLLLSSGVAYYLSQRTQDVRQQASVDAGRIKVETEISPDELVPNQPAIAKFSVNSQGLQIDGVELTFDLKGTFAEAPTLRKVDNVGLDIAFQKIEPVTDGYRVYFISSAPLGQTFNSSINQNFVELDFTPTQPGNVQIVFSQADSIATVHLQSPPKDELATLSNLSIKVGGDEVDPTPPSVDTSPTPTPTTVSDNSENDDDNGVGGKVLKTCGGSCTVNTDCANNLICYAGQCRNGNNPTNNQCHDKPDTGIHNTCDQYCANTGECAEGLTCYYNRCRNPRNVTNSSCAEPVQRSSGTGGTTTRSNTTSNTTSTVDDDYLAMSNDTEDTFETYDESVDNVIYEPEVPYQDPSLENETVMENEVLDDEDSLAGTPVELDNEDAQANPLTNIFIWVIGGLSILAVLITISLVYLAKKGATPANPILKTDTLEHPIQPPTTTSSMSTFAGTVAPKTNDPNQPMNS